MSSLSMTSSTSYSCRSPRWTRCQVFIVFAPPDARTDLRSRRLSDHDRWNLALVQRDEVWDELRMPHLLDSLTAAIPPLARSCLVGFDSKRWATDAHLSPKRTAPESRK